MNRFAQLIHEQVALRGVNKLNSRGGTLKLAKELGVHNSIVKQWLDGADVRLSTLEKVLKYLGGDISRAFPNYIPHPTSEPEYSFIGSITNYKFNGVNGSISVKLTFNALLDNCRYWSSTSGDTYIIHVEGDAMSPLYYNGDVLFCRVPTSTPINGTPVIATTKNGDTIFRIYSRHIVSGSPIIELKSTNHAIESQLLAEKDVTIKYIVLKSLRG